MNFELSYVPERTVKPRKHGVTMMMDKGLSMNEVENFIEASGHLTDVVKFGFGTSYVTKNLKEKIASIKWPSILQGKRISLDDSLKQVPKQKVKKTKLQAPAKQPKVKKIKPEPQPKVQAKPKKQPKLKPQVSPTSNRIQIKLPKIGPLFKKQLDQLKIIKRKDTSIRIGKVPLKRLKQNKIDQLSTNVIDIETQIQQLQAQKDWLPR